MNKKYISIHCHFYQPPRVNPWLDHIEVQDLASPFHDWNERINTECYGPNSASRIINPDKKIVDIINNYSMISFNFGPTLLSWLEKYDKITYNNILEADRVSVEKHSGHGNAIAQAYNHIILPLAEYNDKVTQVLWGIEDFKYRFKREPEGMWLPETAANSETLEVLAQHNIKFTILSPFQAKKVRNIEGDENWYDIHNGQIDPSQGYIYKLKNGRTITLFFYDAPISQAVAFEGLLSDGLKFANRLLSGYSSERQKDQLLNIATDGETYGHHFKFGEMALTYAVRDLVNNHNVLLTNYGEFLSLNPPEHEVIIHENTSWSCFHGVGRWNSNCGCKVGNNPGWDQHWRKYLRISLNKLNDQLNNIFEKEASKYLKEPWIARNSYISCILDKKTIDQFFNDNQKNELSKSNKVDLLRLMELQHQAMLMFTSCGWFFDDISGIETIQILRHAARAIQLASQVGYTIEKDFIKSLTLAKSNIAKEKNAKKIYYNFVIPYKVDLKRVISHYAITSLYLNNSHYDSKKKVIYSYTIEQEDFERYNRYETSVIAIGRVKAISNITLESEEAVFVALYLGEHDFQCKINGMVSDYPQIKKDILDTFMKDNIAQVIRKIDHYFPKEFYSLKDLFLEERRKILIGISEQIFLKFQTGYLKLYKKNRRLMDYHIKIDVPINEEFKKAAQFVLSNRLKNKIIEESKSIGAINYSDGISKVFNESQKWGIKLNLLTTTKIVNKIINSKIALLKKRITSSNLKDIIRFLSISKDIGLPINIWNFQNSYFDIYKNPPLLLDEEKDNTFKLLNELELMLNFQLSNSLDS